MLKFNQEEKDLWIRWRELYRVWMELERGALHGDFRESSYLLIGWLPVSIASFLTLFIQFCFVIEPSPVCGMRLLVDGMKGRTFWVDIGCGGWWFQSEVKDDSYALWWEIFLPALGLTLDEHVDLILLLRDFHISSPLVWGCNWNVFSDLVEPTVSLFDAIPADF